jgi:hypothetical protein
MITNLATLDAEDDARDARLAAPAALLAAALWYAKQGIACFPLKPGLKVPATARGFKDASTDTEQIRTWWTITPAANIGLPTGIRFDVIDIDGPPGYLSLDGMRQQDAIPPLLGKAYTSSGGRHLYVQPKPGRGNTARIFPGIDYRGLGGYVVAAPSISAETGRRWAWIDPLALSQVA